MRKRITKMKNLLPKTLMFSIIGQNNDVVSNRNKRPVFLNTMARAYKYFSETKMLFNVLMKKFNHKTLAVKLYHFSLTQFKVITNIKIRVSPVLTNKKKHLADFRQENNLFSDFKTFLAGMLDKLIFSSSLCQVTDPSLSSSYNYFSVLLYSRDKRPFCLNNFSQNRSACIPRIHKNCQRFGNIFLGLLNNIRSQFDFAFEITRTALFKIIALYRPSKLLRACSDYCRYSTQTFYKTIGSVMNTNTLDFAINS